MGRCRNRVSTRIDNVQYYPEYFLRFRISSNIGKSWSCKRSTLFSWNLPSSTRTTSTHSSAFFFFLFQNTLAANAFARYASVAQTRKISLKTINSFHSPYPTFTVQFPLDFMPGTFKQSWSIPALNFTNAQAYSTKGTLCMSMLFSLTNGESITSFANLSSLIVLACNSALLSKKRWKFNIISTINKYNHFKSLRTLHQHLFSFAQSWQRVNKWM